MELTEEMDVAALKIQKHYKNKKKKPQNSNQGFVLNSKLIKFE